MSQFQVLKGLRREGRWDRDLESAQTLSGKEKSPWLILNRKLNWLPKENAQIGKAYIKPGTSMETRNLGTKRMIILLRVKPIEKSSPRHWTFIRQINGQIRLKEKRWIYVNSSEFEHQTLPRMSRKKLTSSEGLWRNIWCNRWDSEIRRCSSSMDQPHVLIKVLEPSESLWYAKCRGFWIPTMVWYDYPRFQYLQNASKLLKASTAREGPSWVLFDNSADSSHHYALRSKKFYGDMGRGVRLRSAEFFNTNPTF